MNMSNKFKKDLERLYKDQDNIKCFDCGILVYILFIDKSPAHWASVNNGIYLCLDCSGEHRGFGVGVSYIKSVTLDQWNESQYNILKVGGNKRLREFLLSNEMPEYLDKKEIYASKLMSYYRRMLKVESRNELFMEPFPPKEHFWDPADISDDIDTNTYNDYNKKVFSGNNKSNNYSGGYNYSSKPNNDSNNLFNFNENSIPDYSQSNSNNTFNNFDNYTDFQNSFPKNEIIISDDHYQQSRNYVSSSYKNTTPSAPKFKNLDPKYKNDARFASIGSEPIDSYSQSSGGYIGTVGSVLGSIWNSSVNAASLVKDKMNEYEVGSKLMYVGGKAFEAITYTGSKVIEKGTEFAQSETLHNIVSKAGEGIGTLKNKITGNKSGGYGEYGNSDRLNGDYSSRGSDDY